MFKAMSDGMFDTNSYSWFDLTRFMIMICIGPSKRASYPALL